jgi:hypothetical protein
VTQDGYEQVNISLKSRNAKSRVNTGRACEKVRRVPRSRGRVQRTVSNLGAKHHLKAASCEKTRTLISSDDDDVCDPDKHFCGASYLRLDVVDEDHLRMRDASEHAARTTFE